MAYLKDATEIGTQYQLSRQESDIWREDYHEFERLANNDLIDDLDESLPEVNDGTLAASLYKLPKRIVSNKLKGRAKAIDSDEAWVTELANMQWENEIVPNANSQAPFHRKWKDAVRKAAIYGSVPLITLFVERGDYIGADFIVAQPQDVLLEAGKVSDYDSDVMFWDVYFTKLQVEGMIERAKKENEEAKANKEDGYNKWDIPALEEILKSNPVTSRDTRHDSKEAEKKGIRKEGIKFCVVVQRGVGAPFYMYHKDTKKTVREWSNPDPTGDVPIHFLYCYQDFVNPYGVGIVKLAGGTQNVLDYFRQADVLATELGFRPPVSISGDIESADLDSIVYAQDAQWFIGNAVVQRQEISNQIYSQLPNRVSMYKISLNQLIPTGDTSIGSGAGDQEYSKTPAGVKFQEQNLSIDDEDFKDNLYITYQAVARSMINTQFANMQGSDIMRLSDEEREILQKAGLDFPEDEFGQQANELEVIWDEARATFDYEIDAEQDKTKDDEQKLEGLTKVAELRQSDPMFDQKLMASGKKLNDGELYADIVSLLSDNEKILEDISPEDQQMQEEQMAQQEMAGQEAPEEQAQDMGQEMPNEAMEQHSDQPHPDDVQEAQIISQIMQQYGVDQNDAMAMREAENSGFEPEEIMEALKRQKLGGDDA